MTTPKEDRDDRIAEEATEWFGRIREGELSSSESKRFAQWLAESPVHVREYLAISETWGALQCTRQWPEETSAELLKIVRGAPLADVVQLSQEKFKRSSVSGETSTRSRKRLKLFTLAACLGIVAVSASWLWFNVERHSYRTARGEQRSVVLPDGSVVQLNTLTKMVVYYDGNRRRIELSKGEAFFRVARDAKRPFDVETPFAVVRAIGTEFNVYNQSGSTRVAVIEGKVAVTRSSAQQGEGELVPTRVGANDYRLPLAAGEQVTVAATGPIKHVTRAQHEVVQPATAWMQRRIVLDNDRIDTAIVEFNRYNKLQMHVRDPELASLRISGVFSADDPRALMKYLDQIQSVDIRDSDDGFVLRRR